MCGLSFWRPAIPSLLRTHTLPENIVVPSSV
jgi:hypothetical protein